MERRRLVKSNKKVLRSSKTPKKNACNLCKTKPNNTLVIAHSLYKKYSFTQNHYYLGEFNSINQKLSQENSTTESEEEQFMSRYHKKSSRIQSLQRLRDVYGMHRQIPRIFHPSIKQILAKCHHRKRLIQYFRMAKVLGIKVESVNFSSFLLSLQLSKKNPEETFKKVLPGISMSGDVERQLLESIGNNQP